MKFIIARMRELVAAPSLSERRERLMREAEQQQLEHELAAAECALKAEWHRAAAAMFEARVADLARDIEGETASIRRVIVGGRQ